jgi:hypothetical protein
MRIVQVSESYSLQMTDDFEEDYDNGVWSYWKSGSDLVLQLSSWLRPESGPLDASDRLQSRLSKASLSHAEAMSLNLPSPSSAAARFTDGSGYVWYYIYMVWEDLCIFATVSGTAAEASGLSSWPFSALRSIVRS